MKPTKKPCPVCGRPVRAHSLDQLEACVRRHLQAIEALVREALMQYPLGEGPHPTPPRPRYPRRQSRR